MLNKRVISAVITACALLWLAWSFWPRPPSLVAIQPCADWRHGCAFDWDGHPARLIFLDPPSPLRPFRVQIQGVVADRLSLTFAMRGMTMGMLSFPLSQNSAALWQNRVVLPVCTQARTDWLITISSPDIQKIIGISLPAAGAL